MNKLSFFSLFLAAALLPGCSGSNNDNKISGLDEKSARELLKAHPWKISSKSTGGKAEDIYASENDPYIIVFGEGGVLESVNFSECSHNEEWDIKNGRLVINGEYFDVSELGNAELRLDFEENGTERSFTFEKEDGKESFPSYPLEKTYKVISGSYGGDEFTWEDDSDILRSKVLIEDGSALITYSRQEHISWEAFSCSFAFSEEAMRGYEVACKSNGDISLKWYVPESDLPKSSAAGITVMEGEIILRECNVWDFISGPDWILTEVDRNGTAATADLPAEPGTIWYFNINTGKVEERTGSTSEDIEYMDWSFTEDPTEDSVHIDIETGQGETVTFALMRGNIAQLELKADIGSYTYTFKFEVEEE